jgi:hypothetical protein
VDEYVSVRLLEMLAGAERALTGMLESRCPHVELLRAAVMAAEGRVADTLERELLYRAGHGYVCAEPSSPHALERYLDRASRLKKHFQEVLFLESETFQVADRIHHWVAAFVALLASTWAFAWQIALMNRRPSTESQVGSGIVMLAVIAGLVYAAKDRIKELGRTWISGNVHRLYAQRVARYRAPARRLPKRDIIVAARESCDQSELARPDPLNPESGATVPATLIHYVHKGTVSPQAQLTAAGVRRIKHVFRYDLSPLFARLDDAVKPVPVLDVATRGSDPRATLSRKGPPSPEGRSSRSERVDVVVVDALEAIEAALVEHQGHRLLTEGAAVALHAHPHRDAVAARRVGERHASRGHVEHRYRLHGVVEPRDA